MLPTSSFSTVGTTPRDRTLPIEEKHRTAGEAARTGKDDW